MITKMYVINLFILRVTVDQLTGKQNITQFLIVLLSGSNKKEF